MSSNSIEYKNFKVNIKNKEIENIVLVPMKKEIVVLKSNEK
ncbi:hypothetical protein [Romboutsia sp.]